MKEKNLSKKNLTSNIQPLTTSRGITLIALVITIIVMLILVAVTITMAINGGLFDYAGKATGDTKNAVNAEQQLANGRIKVGDTWYDSIGDYLNNVESPNQEEGTPPQDEGGMKTYDQTPKDSNNHDVLTANATYESGEYTAVIPKGFKIVEGLNRSKSIAEGLVIEDKDGNQFVWIPVTGYTKDGSPDEHGLYPSFKTAFTRKYEDNIAFRTSWSDYTEPYNSYEGEEDEYYEMMLSVQENGGFYIGRFEAGSTTPRTNTANGTTTPIVVKRDQYPYNYIGWGPSMTTYTGDITYDGNNQGLGAVALSKGMYPESSGVGVVSTLCYGVQWDAMLNWINDSTHSVTSSASWGNYSNSTLKTITRSQAQMSTSGGWTSSGTISTGKLLTTGADDSFAAKNIFDVAGNCFEWTMEAFSTDNRVYRGRRLPQLWLSLSSF